MVMLPKAQARGSSTGRPIMVLLDVLGKKWSLRILWELNAGGVSFRQLREQCDNISPTMLNSRLRELRELNFVELNPKGYELTIQGEELVAHFAKLDQWAMNWSRHLNS